MRRGFTLMELLIVITIIMVLAGLLFPAVNMIKQQANTVKCSNNMRQIALAIEIYRQNHNDTFPGYLHELLPDGFDAKCFICPFDKFKGADPYMNRNQSWQSYNKLHTDATSYCYEASGWVDPTGSFFDGGDISYFYRDLAAADRPAAGTVSWADGKQHQQKFGNLKTPGVRADGFGAPFSPDTMPIVRCYFHTIWPASTSSDLTMPRKVNNISLGFNTFWSIPYWEMEIDPALK